MERLRVVAFVAAYVLLLVIAQPVEASSLDFQGTSYTVQPGDTLSAIASRHGTTVRAIMSANGLSSTVIRAGQTLSIPSGSRSSGSSSSGSYNPSPSTGGSAGGSYIVRAGDTLSGIAASYGVSLAALKSANGIYSDRILPGQGLAIPSGGGYATPQYQPAPQSSYRSTSSCASSYIVQRGDTLSGIASRCGVSVSALMSSAGLSSSALRVGQSLSISSGSAPSPAVPSAPAVPPSSAPRSSPPSTPLPTPEPPFPSWIYGLNN